MRAPLSVAYTLCLLGGLLVASALPSTYQCAGEGVVCASNSAPGRLAPLQTPQFVVLSHDDAITVTTDKAIRVIVNQFTNANGCNVPFTFFVSGGAGTNCAIARRLLADNHEIATHTMAHAQLVPGSIDITDQIASQRAWLANTCGIPAEKMVGFRAPYLMHNPESRAALQSLGFNYDASIIESWPSQTSPSAAERLWPYQMSSGIPQNCQWMAPATCSATERYSLFELPMLQFISPSGTALSSMDPTAESSAALTQQLLQQLNYSYAGNRAPMGIYLHTPWFAAKPFHAEALTSFIRQALAMPDVVFVTNTQLVEWMKAPVPASQMASWLRCNPVNFVAAQRAPCTTYTVAPGDSLFKIMAEQEVELAELMSVNPSLSSSSAIYTGQRLRLPPWTDACPDALAGQPPCRNHTVASGDFLYGLAESYNLTVADLLTVNPGLTTTSTLSLGQAIRIPPWPQVECFWGNWSMPPSVPTPTTDAPGPAPAPGAQPDEVTCGSELLELELTLTGFDAATFEALLPQFTASMGALLRVPAACVSLSRTADVGLNASGQRRLLAQRSLLSDAQLLAVVAIHTPNATESLAYLKGAQQLGSLAIMMSLLGGQVDRTTATALNAQGLPITASPAPATPASPAPTPSAAPTIPSAAVPDAAVAGSPAESKSNSHLGAILDGAIGGGLGAIVIIALAWFIIKRRKAAAGSGTVAGTSGLRGAYAVSNPAYTAGASAHISTSRAMVANKEAFELTEVVEQTGTPSSARRRNGTPFGTSA